MSLMPAGIIAYLKLTSPGFLSSLYGNPFGICAMTICLFIYLAAYWMGTSLMPAGIIAYLKLTSPGFLSSLYGNPFGICAMTICLFIYLAAYWMGTKIVDIEV